jgi:hypothetical protein
MATAAYELEALSEYEGEYEGELEGEYELEWEGELEGEYESEEFFRRLAALAAQTTQSPALRGVGLTAARSALGGAQPELEAEYEGEWESELNPIRRVYPDALMEHLGHAAAEAQSEAEAEALVGALIPLAARLIPRIAPAIMRTAPQLIRGVSRVARTLRTNPVTRPMVRAIPTVVRRTTADLARQVSRGRPITTGGAARTLARQTAQVLGDPRQCVAAYRRSRALDRRYHRAAPAAAAPPGLMPAAPIGMLAGVGVPASGGCRCD